MERTLRSAGCFRSLETLKAVLANGPQPGSGPVAILQNKAGASVELWPGFMREGRYILAPLLRDARRRVIVDLRGTSWGGGVDVVNEQAVLHLVSSAGVASESMLPRGVAVNVRTRRVYLDRGSGVTNAGVLQHLLQEFGAPSVFLEQLEEALGEGSGLPSIP